jgi:hypothetical protein
MELTTPSSILRTNLQTTEDSKIDYLAKKISEHDTLSRGIIDKYSIGLPKNSRKVLRDFRELMYHITGASFLNCESAIPREEYFDYSDIDLTRNDLYISQYAIFRKLFLEIIYNSLYENIFYAEIIDSLSFEDILAIRSIIDESVFIEKYNLLTKVTSGLLNNENIDSIFSNMDDILHVSNEIHKNFTNEIDKEILLLEKRKSRKLNDKIIYNFISLFSSILSFIIPPAGIISTALTMNDSVPSLISNVSAIMTKKNSNFRNTNGELLRKNLKKFDIKNETELLDVVDLLNQARIIRMQRKT